MLEALVKEANPLRDTDGIASASLKHQLTSAGRAGLHVLRGGLYGGVVGAGIGAITGFVTGSDVSTYASSGAALGMPIGGLIDSLQYIWRVQLKIEKYRRVPPKGF